MTAGMRKSFRLPESSRHFPPRVDFRTSHIKIELALDFAKERIDGACTLTVEPVRQNLDTIRLDACQFDIQGVAVDGSPAEFEYDNSNLEVAMKPASGPRTIRVEYGAKPVEGLYFTAPDPEHPDREVQAWTHSEAEAARYWYPCHDHPAGKATSEVVLRVPKDFRVISNGKLLSVTDDGGVATYHWREDAPHSTYLTSFIAGRFGVIEEEVDGIKLRYNFPESKRDDVLRYFGETPRMMQVFKEITGVKYPWEKYDQTTVQDFIFGGEENIDATTLATTYYPDAATEDDFQVTYSQQHVNPVDLVAHELAHQWFGDYVTCADWPHAWLNESFATYFQALYVERTRGVDQMRWDLQARVQDYFEEDDTEYRRPIVEREYVWPDDIFDAHLYPKGACMLHQLRFIMGDELFFKGISEYLKAHAFSTAETRDLLNSMVKVSGLQLEEFFEQSFYKAGHPEFDVSYAWDEQAKTATLRVRQVQKVDETTPVFKLPCEIVFYVNGERMQFRVQLDSAEQTLTFALPAKPAIAEFDPRRWLLKTARFDKGADLLLNQLRDSKDAWSRAEAATDLGKMRSERAVQGLKEAAAKEQFWHVRSNAFKALGEVGGDAALKALIELGLPKDRWVRRGLAAALGNFKEEKARELLIQMLKSDESPYVRSEAALSLAKAWPEGALPHLKEAMKVSSPNEALAEACLDAMGKVRDEQVKAIIRENLRYGKPTRVRIGALRAIKGRGYVTEEEVPLLREIIRTDKEFRVRLYAVNDLVRTLGDRRFIEDVYHARSDPDLRVKRKSLETYHELAAAAEFSATVSRLKSEVEQLKGENSRLAKAVAG
jgi:aminopeptidase N